MMIIPAKKHLESSGDIVASAEACGEAVVRALQTERRVRVDFEGMRGASPSYFTVLLDRIVAAVGLDSIRARVEFEFDTTTQKRAFHLSMNTF